MARCGRAAAERSRGSRRGRRHARRRARGGPGRRSPASRPRSPRPVPAPPARWPSRSRPSCPIWPCPRPGSASTSTVPAGRDVVFRFAANPGMPLQPLAKVASGGELARAMLALRLVLTEGPPVLVFDEVDAGIGGAAALAVGRSLGAIADDHQVLVVTHLAQVAAWADAHVVVDKQVAGRHHRDDGGAGRRRRPHDRAGAHAVGHPRLGHRPGPRPRAARRRLRHPPLSRSWLTSRLAGGADRQPERVRAGWLARQRSDVTQESAAAGPARG